MKKALLTVSTLSLLMAVSCKKNDGSSSSGKAATLTSGKWQMTASTSQSFNNGVGSNIDDDYASMDACEKDDYYIFSNTNNAIIIDAGATKCNASEPQQYTSGQWTLTSNDTKMIQSNAVLTIYWNIDQLDNNTLTMTNYDTSGSMVYKSTQTYKHIN